MEENFKKDVVREVRAGGGRILLHDEVEDRPGVFAIVPIWENVKESDIMTPRQVFEDVASEGYKVSPRHMVKFPRGVIYLVIYRSTTAGWQSYVENISWQPKHN